MKKISLLLAIILTLAIIMTGCGASSNKTAMDMIAHYQSLDRQNPLFEVLQGSLLLSVVLELFSDIPGKWRQSRHGSSRALRPIHSSRSSSKHWVCCARM